MTITNKYIASFFDKLLKFAELHEENPYKIRSYKNAYLAIRKAPNPLALIPKSQITSLHGIGNSSANKIIEIIDNQQLKALQAYIDKTPKGIVEMLKIKGIGPKKIRSIWKELKIETPIELLYACNENRLIELNGFGQKTQEDIAQKIYFSMRNSDLFLWAAIEEEAQKLFDFFRKELPQNTQLSFTGAFRRKDPFLAKIELISDADFSVLAKAYPQLDHDQDNTLMGKTKGNIPFSLHGTTKENFVQNLFETSCYDGFKDLIIKRILSPKLAQNENDIFAQANLPYYPPELRWGTQLVDNQSIKNLIQDTDIKGIIHTHSQWSDGHNSIEEMALAAKASGFEYLVITDHSKSAFYANGLSPESVLEQMSKIDEINQKITNFHIFKGIESDILFNGNLDYEDNLLAEFDIVIASIHSQLKMDQSTATKRIIKAIEHPATKILGHLSSRLLLARQGYPLDYEKVFDACAAHHVAIELNANPYRLDIDYQLIRPALDKGVKISINPDAHSIQGIQDIKYGVLMARKAGLTPSQNISSFSYDEISDFYKK